MFQFRRAFLGEDIPVYKEKKQTFSRGDTKFPKKEHSTFLTSELYGDCCIILVVLLGTFIEFAQPFE